MKRDNKKEVMNALIMVFQFGINMIVPIFFSAHWPVCGLGKRPERTG